MATVLAKQQLLSQLYEFVIHAPALASKAKPGQFVIVMKDAQSERIPLTLADWDKANGTITLILMVAGTSTTKLAETQVGEEFFALTGPLGQPTELKNYAHVALIAGGVGAAPVYPIAKAFFKSGSKVTIIHGARSQSLLFWQEKLKQVAHNYTVITDDGSMGKQGLVTEPLQELLTLDKSVEAVFAIGPAIMMKFCSLTTKLFNIKTYVSLNTIMIDGTGMCGGCRVTIGKNTKFACVDGPEFDGHLVDWDNLLTRQKSYKCEEKCSLNLYLNTAKNNN